MTIPAKISIGFGMALAVFAFVLTVSVVEHHRTASTLKVLEDGYIPLAITVGEARATQSLFGKLLERVLQERDPTATRHWLNTARRIRPTIVRRGVYEVDRAFRLNLGTKEAAILELVRGHLRAIQDAYASTEDTYDELFRAMVSKDELAASSSVAKLRFEERRILKRLENAGEILQRTLATESAAIAERERQTVVLLILLTAFAIAMALAVMWWARRILSPLPILHARVLAVARGERTPRVEPAADDEIGRLAKEFERMVEAVGKAHEDQLRTRARLMQSERLAAVGRMAAHVAHEVRNPLSSIGLNVELLEEDVGEVDDEVRVAIGSIKAEIDRLTEITGEYLRLARVPEPELVRQDMGAFLHSLSDFVKSEMDEAGVTLHLDVAPGLLVAFDSSQLRQVFLNLLRNSREAMPGGGDIWLTANGSGNEIAIRLADNGSGIVDGEREKIFDLHYTTKETGSGLGLPLSQQIVVAHRGSIECFPHEPKGTAFVLRFPTLVQDGSVHA